MLVAEKYRQVWEKDGEEDGEEKDGEDGEEKTGETVLREWIQGVKVCGRCLVSFMFCVGKIWRGGLRWVGWFWGGLCAGFLGTKSRVFLSERDLFCFVEE